MVILFSHTQAKELESLILEIKSTESKVHYIPLFTVVTWCLFSPMLMCDFNWLQINMANVAQKQQQTYKAYCTPFVYVQIKAYLLCSKLRPAYLLAVKLDSSRAGPLVQDVLRAAEDSKDSVMQNICQQWLSEHHKSPQQQRQGRPNAR